MVVAVVAIIAMLGMPAFLDAWKSATLTGGAQEVVATLNTARQLAIKEDTSVCVTADAASTITGYGTKVRLFTNTTCTGPAWSGTGTDSDGWIPLDSSVLVKAPPTSIVFSYLGDATPAGTWSVCNPTDTNRHADVVVAASGRVRITYQASPC